MPLTKYKQKRNFKATPEPGGRRRARSSSLVFVVQKHHASHLHYDLRLEMEGVLKSWAVPKGPSLNPEDKRLAMMVEDHPYDYKDFEGNIPAGNYGAGNVIVWDTGTYRPVDTAGDEEKTLLAGLKKGHISFILEGKKLKGEFSLVKLRGKQENAWLLVKKQDKYAKDIDVLKKNKSVLSSSSIESLDKKYPRQGAKEIARRALKKTSASKVAAKKPAVKKKVRYVKPMLAQLAPVPFDSEEWIFEIKYDGYRAMAWCDGEGNATLYSRNFLSFNKVYAPVVAQLENIGHQCLLDGEVVVEDEKGRSHFQLLQSVGKTGETARLKYYVFDILELDGNDLSGLTLLERKALLELLLKKSGLENVYYSGHISGRGKAFFKKAVKAKLEGIIAKKADSAYHSGQRNGQWLKIKISNEQEAVIGGITPPKGSRKHFGSLLLGVYHNGKFIYAGNCGTGFDEKTLAGLYTKFKPLFIKNSPFDTPVKAGLKPQWIKPVLVCQVKFAEWTNDGSMRHPVYLGLRKDKKAKEVTRENTASMKTATKAPKGENPDSSGKELKVGKVTLKLTNQDKIYWPDEKITKGELVDYYAEIAPVILPYLKERPESLHRFPNGIKAASFYQKDLDRDKIPAWVNTQQVYSESNEEHLDYLVCNDKATLMYMANLGCIEIHPWNSRIKSLDKPDWIVIDLDPEAIPFSEVIKTALATKKVCDQMEVECYCKTSGATGLHIYIPLAARYGYEIARNFAHVIAQQVHALEPGITSLLRQPKKRQKKVYVDYLQNSRGQTLAAPYSLRPRPNATVSTPLQWKEVNSKLDPAKFTIKTIFKRLDKMGDIWKPVSGKGIDIKKALANLAVD